MLWWILFILGMAIASYYSLKGMFWTAVGFIILFAFLYALFRFLLRRIFGE